MANYLGKAITTGCYQSNGLPSCSLKTELMDLESSIWVSGPDYSLTSAYVLCLIIPRTYFNYDKLKRSFSERFGDTPLYQLQKQHISLVAFILAIKSLNSRTTLGVSLEHWPKDEMGPDRLHWGINSWLLVVGLKKGSKFSL